MPIDAPIHTNEANLARVLGAGLPVVLVFWRRNCAPCDQLVPTLGLLARKYSGRALVARINADEEPNLISRYDIGHLPTLVFVKGGREVATAVGTPGEAELDVWLDHLLKGSTPPAVPAGPSVALAGGTAPPPGAAPRGSGPAAGAGAGSHPVLLTDDNFQQTIASSDVPVLVDFWAAWCGPCKMIAPVVEELARAHAGKLLVGKLNVDENQITAGRFGIMSIPTLLVFRNGQIADRIVGALPAPALRQRVAKFVK